VGAPAGSVRTAGPPAAQAALEAAPSVGAASLEVALTADGSQDFGRGWTKLMASLQGHIPPESGHQISAAGDALLEVAPTADGSRDVGQGWTELMASVEGHFPPESGRWRSDEMMRCLHLTAEPIMRDFARKMLAADFTLAPSQLVPSR